MADELLSNLAVLQKLYLEPNLIWTVGICAPVHVISKIEKEQ